MDHKIAIRQFVRGLLANKGDDKMLNDGSYLLTSGRLDSVDAVQIVVMLEERFGVDFSKIGFDQTMIDSVDAIDSLVRSARPENEREPLLETGS